ncbi:MAG: hypothetical protein KGQ52_13110 [Alphaproteobacteria bacterium]|nr:hypothetical protein [Alphaproteobacteria bacterium]
MLALLALAAAAAVEPPRAWVERPCPAAVGPNVICSEMRDEAGALVLAARPRNANGILIVHAHGGPRLDPPAAGDNDEDLDRFAAFVRAGYGWVGSSYRRGGYGVRMAAADVDRSRALYWASFGRPRLTILHGQSWGGNVAARLAESGALDVENRALYDGVLLTAGVLSGGSQAYQFRADLRAVYQYYCRNHPAADEAAYPVWQGLPLGARLTRAQLRQRVNDCTGAELPAAARTPAQAQRLRDIVAVTGVAESQLVPHLAFATFTFRDLVMVRLSGRNPFDNSTRRYSGSADDAALNAGVPRFAADPQGRALLSFDADLTGRIVLPTITLHSRADQTVSPDASRRYAEMVAGAGNAPLLLSLFAARGTHSRLSDAEYTAAIEALTRWVETGAKPSPAQVIERCTRIATPEQPCSID